MGAMRFTDSQQKVIDLRNRNILVSAAAGSGKTAVLVERIVKMITDGDEPFDVDRLLVVTFTKAAASQMREKIAAAIEKRLERDPENRHLQRQATLLHNAQITTIDSFCTFLLRNNFNDIGLDPGFRQMDEMETKMRAGEELDKMLEEEHKKGTEEFHQCIEYFCPGMNDSDLNDRILTLYKNAMSHPWPDEWLAQRRADYDCASEDELFMKNWVRDFLLQVAETIGEYEDEYSELVKLSEETGGPYPYADFLENESKARFAPVRAAAAAVTATGTSVWKALWNSISICCCSEWDKIPSTRGKKYSDIDPEMKDAVKGGRDDIKGKLKSLNADFFAESPGIIVKKMCDARGPLGELIRLTQEFADDFSAAKKDDSVIDFNDLEHMALMILCDRGDNGSVRPSKAALSYQDYFKEVLIDEYQDSNDVQEMMLSMISGEENGNYDRFMVGDVKQSIYKFRLARPEIFMNKYAEYKEDDEHRIRVDLDRNFRSRRTVLDAVNSIFARICRRETGGVDYDENVFLKHGAAAYPGDSEDDFEDADPKAWNDDKFRAELLIIDGAEKEMPEDADESEHDADANDTGDGCDNTNDSDGPLSPKELGSRRCEALAIAQRIHRLVSEEYVTDPESGELRHVKFGDIVILLRALNGWDDEFREVFEREGIPCYVTSRTGYFAADEIRTVLQFLRVLDNPRQDIPLYGVMRGYFGGFKEDEIALVRARKKDTDLYEALAACAGVNVLHAADDTDTTITDTGSAKQEENTVSDIDTALSDKCSHFMEMIATWRSKLSYLSIHELLEEVFTKTGYEDYIHAMPAGTQRGANLRLFMSIAADFEKTKYTSLFHFLRYIDEMHQRDVDMGEANTLDENADVVRIMTIHKSKGLEFPVCFVSGLSKQMNMRDTTAAILCDNERGIGIDWCDTKDRVRSGTFRKAVISEMIRRDSIGEELRVLYVAMTRAKEKLIMTGYSKDYEATQSRREMRVMAAAGAAPTGRLPVSMIESSRNYYDLVMNALMMNEELKEAIPVLIRSVSADDLEISMAVDQDGLLNKKMTLGTIEQKVMSDGIRALPDSRLAGDLEKRFSWRYPHESLKGLITKTTVTEIKKHYDEALWDEDRAAAAASDGLNIYEDTRNNSRGGSAGKISGASRGAVIHRCMEIFDYKEFPDPGTVSAAQFKEWRGRQHDAGQFTDGEVAELKSSVILPFLHSAIAARMAAADSLGLLRREQPFVMGIDADRVSKEYPADETVLIQGIIDAFFIEEGKIVIVDYKTDHVKTPEELIKRYRIQLDYYGEALGNMLKMEVGAKILWSFALEKEIML